MSYPVLENRALTQPLPSTPQPPATQALRAVALRAHRQAAGGEPEPGRWRPSGALLAMLRELLLTSATHYPAAEAFAPPARFGVREPDEPGFSEQLMQMEADFVELSEAHRELVIEFMKLLRHQASGQLDD